LTTVLSPAFFWRGYYQYLITRDGCGDSRRE
jgi:hypothetical protein